MSQVRQSNIILSVSSIFILIVIVALGIQVNNVISGSTDDTEIKPLIGIITSDSIHDQSWGSLAFEGKQNILNEYDVNVVLISDKDTNGQRNRATLELIDEGATLIIGHGGEFSSIFSEMAPYHKDVHFVTLSGSSDHDNQTSIRFHHTSSGYFAGYIAGLLTETNKVGVIDAYGPPGRGTVGFFAGLHEVNEEAELYHRIVESRDDERKAERLARELIESGVDVIFTRGNAFNRAVIHEAMEADIYAIGFLTDQAYMAPDHVITSIINDTPRAYMTIMEQYLSEKGLQSGELMVDFKDGVYQLAPFGPMVDDETSEKILNHLEKYINGQFNFDDLNDDDWLERLK